MSDVGPVDSPRDVPSITHPEPPSQTHEPSPVEQPMSPGAANAIPDQKIDADLPMTLQASVVLTSLPGDAKKALEQASRAAAEAGSIAKGEFTSNVNLAAR